MYFRIFLIVLIIYLLLRMVWQWGSNKNESGADIKTDNSGKKVSKDTGDYIDYEEVDD